MTESTSAPTTRFVVTMTSSIGLAIRYAASRPRTRRVDLAGVSELPLDGRGVIDDVASVGLSGLITHDPVCGSPQNGATNDSEADRVRKENAATWRKPPDRSDSWRVVST